MKRFFPPAKKPRIDVPEEISSDEEAPSTSSEKKKNEIWKSVNEEPCVRKIFAQTKLRRKPRRLLVSAMIFCDHGDP
jgi:hypothetical protein